MAHPANFILGVGDFFTLRTRERRLARIPLERQEEARRLRRLGINRLEGAEGLAGTSFTASALLVLTESARLLAEAALCERGLDRSGTWDELVRKAAAAIPGAPSHLQETLATLADRDSLRWEGLPTDAALRLRGNAEEMVRWLASHVEPYSAASVRGQRLLRIGIVALVVVGAVALGIIRVLTPVNVALHKPVRLSGTLTGGTAAPDGSGAVNGLLEMTYGVHTQADSLAWVQVDLQAPHSIKSVAIHNRRETRFQDEGLPLILEVSADGTTYTEVARRTEHFTESAPWVAKLGGRVARYVKVRTEKPSYVALTEIEVFGKPQP